MDTHAKTFYEQIRKRKSDVESISQNTGFAIEDIRKIKNHIFFNEYDLGDEALSRFDPLYDSDNRIVYLYQPEGRGDWGEVAYTFSDDSIQIIKRAGENSAIHNRMALSKVKERIEKNNLPISFTQAWY